MDLLGKLNQTSYQPDLIYLLREHDLVATQTERGEQRPPGTAGKRRHERGVDLHALDGSVEGVRATLVLLREDGLVPLREYLRDVERDRALRLLGLLIQLLDQARQVFLMLL